MILLGLYIVGLVVSFIAFTYLSAYKDYYTDYNDDLFVATIWPLSVPYHLIMMTHKRIIMAARNKKKLDDKKAAAPKHHNTKLGLNLYK